MSIVSQLTTQQQSVCVCIAVLVLIFNAGFANSACARTVDGVPPGQASDVQGGSSTVLSLKIPLANFKEELKRGPVETFNLVSRGVNTFLRVPTAYIDSYITKSAYTKSLHLQMFWPSLEKLPSDFSDRSSEAAYEKSEALRETGRFFGVEFNQGELERMQDGIRYHVANDWVRDLGGYANPQFTSYFQKLLHNRLPKQMQSEFLVPTDPKFRERVFIECPVNSVFPATHVYCTGHNYLGHLVYAEYTFAFAHLQDWKAIDAAVRQLFAVMLAPANADFSAGERQ